MKRIVYDVPKWSVFLHREARGLYPADRDDAPRRKFEDELFERLYAGAPESLLKDQEDSALRAWAERVHAACDQLPTFARLQAECRGAPDAAAAALETVMAELEPLITETETADLQRLRRAVRSGCEKASAIVEELRDLTAGLEHVAFGHLPGAGTQVGEQRLHASSRSLARRVRDDPRLQRIAILAGRFRRIAIQKQRTKVKHGADEITDIERGGDIGRLLPAELAKLVHRRLRLVTLRDLAERQAMQYALSGNETLGKGPLVVALDKSGSMEGSPDIWATAVALALLEVTRRERRPFALLGFDGAVKHEAFVEVGDVLPEAGLFISCGGGTNIANVVSRGLDIIAGHQGALRKADIVLVTDGGSDSSRAPVLRGRARELGVTVLGFGVGTAVEQLLPWCDEAHAVLNLDALDDTIAETLFGR